MNEQQIIETPYEILHFVNGTDKDPIHIDKKFWSKAQAIEYAKENGYWDKCIIWNDAYDL